jgi:transcriptional regulator with XRE-family HTH domain
MNATGKILRQRRKSYGKTMRQVHDAGGPALAYQSDVERGKRDNVGAMTLIRWCDAIGCEPIMVFGDIVSLVKREAVDRDHASGI